MPGFGPGTPFLFELSDSPEGVVAPGAVAAAGVDVVSEALSPDGVGAAGAVAVEVASVVAVAAAGAVVEGDEESGEAEAGLTLVSDCESDAGKPGKRPKREEGSLRVTLLLGFGDLFDRPDKGDEPAVIVDVLVVDIVVFSFSFISLLPIRIGLESWEMRPGAKGLATQGEGLRGLVY